MKRRSFLIILFSCLFIFSGCSSVSREQKSMYNDNSLITKEGDTYNFTNRVGEIDDSKIEIKYGKFYGSQTIWIIEVEKQGEIEFDFNSKVNSGKFKGVLISPENEIINIFENDNEGSYKVQVSEGKYRFKIIGNDARGKVEVELELDNDMKILGSDI